MKQPVITIITVCRNAGGMIEKTIDSVIAQTYSSIEYIIVDGDSADNTMKLVKEAAEKFPIKYISEPDKGIYDAMNKGINLATGEYIQFLNAGDELLESNVIALCVEEMAKKQADVYYGNIEYQHTDGTCEIRKYGRWCGKKIYFLTGDCINHQAMFASRKLFFEDMFDLSYKICADREWMMRISKKGKRFIDMPIVICRYLLDETSASIANADICREEAERCVKKHFLIGYGIFRGFEYFRGNRVLSKILHAVYRIIYIRK